MTIFLAIIAFTLIALVAWGGMRLMQRATGCELPLSSGDPSPDQSSPRS